MYPSSIGDQLKSDQDVTRPIENSAICRLMYRATQHTQGGSIYIIWIRHKADESNTDWCKFYEESIYQLSKDQEDSAARFVESQPVGQKSSSHACAEFNPATFKILIYTSSEVLSITHVSASWSSHGSSVHLGHYVSCTCSQSDREVIRSICRWLHQGNEF